MEGVTLVGGGPVDTPVLSDALRRAPRLMAADGGADACLSHGLTPEAVIGDMDSVSPAARAAFADRLTPVASQDDTDFAKALGRIAAPFVIGVGFLGARIDHALAVFSHMGARGADAVPPVVLLSAHDCAAMVPPALSLDVTEGTRVSLWPLAAARLTSQGLVWPLDGLVLQPSGRVGTSNRADASAPPVRLTCEGPCLILLPPEALDALLAGLGFADTPR